VTKAENIGTRTIEAIVDADDQRETRADAMVIRTLISADAAPLKPTDTVEHALGMLLEMRVRHLPVVSSEGLLLGLMSEDRLLDATGPDATVESLLGSKPVSAAPDLHVFEATKIIVSHALSTLPIADAEGRYLGLVKRHDIFDQFAKMLSTHEAGAILALEIDSKNYSVSQLAYSIEQNNVRILSIATEAPDSGVGMIRITLKLDTTDTSRIRHVLEHKGYHIVAAFSEAEGDEELRYRVEEFMKYLEV
jgi:predicted transcriptional regulator